MIERQATFSWRFRRRVTQTAEEPRKRARATERPAFLDNLFIVANIASLRNEVKQHHICEANASYRIAIHHLTNNRFYGVISVIGGVVMKENKLVELSMDFSVDIINLVKFLKSNHEAIPHKARRNEAKLRFANSLTMRLGRAMKKFHPRTKKTEGTHWCPLFFCYGCDLPAATSEEVVGERVKRLRWSVFTKRKPR